jgi:hypothetical protein
MWVCGLMGGVIGRTQPNRTILQALSDAGAPSIVATIDWKQIWSRVRGRGAAARTDGRTGLRRAQGSGSMRTAAKIYKLSATAGAHNGEGVLVLTVDSQDSSEGHRPIWDLAHGLDAVRCRSQGGRRLSQPDPWDGLTSETKGISAACADGRPYHVGS